MEPAPTQTRGASRRRSCHGCGYDNLAWALICDMCGDRLLRVVAEALPSPTQGAPRRRASGPLAVLAIGAGLAVFLGVAPFMQYVGWFLTSLVHEIGHCIAAWIFGSPAYPAIRIDGHAAAVHGEQRIFIVVVVWAGLAWLFWQARHRPVLRVVAAVGLVMHPILAFSAAHDVIHLLAGHTGELAFAGLAFHRAFSGGFTESVPERVTYAMVAWFLLGKNVLLNIGLMMSEPAREAYLGNGSFGLEQDFMRAARELGWSLGGVGALMLFLSLSVLPILWLVRSRLSNQTPTARA